MADTKLTGLTELSVPAIDDWLYWVDKSDTTDDAAGSSRKASLTRGLGFLNNLFPGRLSLVTGDPFYAPQNRTASATDTTADTCDFAAAHGWKTGTMVTPTADGGGLSWGTTYYIRAVDTDTVSFHPTFADADADTDKVNLTAAITAELIALGITWDILYWVPFDGNVVSLYDGTRWRLYQASEVSLALAALTSDKNYDVFLYDNAGTLTLELSAAWTSDTARADALAQQDGVDVKSGAATRRHVGTFRTVSTTTIEDSHQKRFLWNAYHRCRVPLFKTDITSSWTYTTAAWRQVRADATNQVEVVCGKEGASEVRLWASARRLNSSANVLGGTSIGENGTTTAFARPQIVGRTGNYTTLTQNMHEASFQKRPRLGYSTFAWLEWGDAVGTSTWYGTPTGGSHTTGIMGDFDA